jgi:hypothetical protein
VIWPRSAGAASRADLLQAQLGVIVGGQETGFVELRWRTQAGHGMSRCFEPITRTDAVVDRALSLGQRTDTFVGAAPRGQRSGRRGAVGAAWCLWVDCDDPRASRRLAAFQPRPTLILRSGREGGLHGWWALREPLPVALLEPSLRELADRLGADRACCDASRIMRAAGTFNHKHGDPRPVVAERLERDTFRVEDVLGKVPRTRRETAPRLTGPRSASAAGGEGALLAIPATLYVPALTGHEVRRDGKATCPFHSDRRPSLHAYPDPARGWCCYGGCGAGSIIDFGARLYDIEPRGSGFFEIRRRLERDLRAAAR